MAFFTDTARRVIEANINMAVPWYLMSSFAYYQEDESLLADTYFDEICVLLRENWDQITHRHKCFVDRTQLGAATGYALDFKNLPTIITASTYGLIRRSHALLREQIVTNNIQGLEYGLQVYKDGELVYTPKPIHRRTGQ